jgi:hypothetical protein
MKRKGMNSPEFENRGIERIIKEERRNDRRAIVTGRGAQGFEEENTAHGPVRRIPLLKPDMDMRRRTFFIFS